MEPLAWPYILNPVSNLDNVFFIVSKHVDTI
jgi:hypothetical protein